MTDNLRCRLHQWLNSWCQDEVLRTRVTAEASEPVPKNSSRQRPRTRSETLITILGKLLIHVCPCHRTIYFGTGQRAVTLCSWKGNCSPSTYSKVCPMNQWRRSVIKYGGGVRVSQVKPSNSQITPSVNDFQTLITVIGKKLWFCDFYQQSRFLTAYRRPKISFTFHFDTGLSFLMLWNLQSYPTTVFNEIMWHFTGVKTDSDSSFKFSVGRDPLPAPGSASLQWICSSAYRREMTVVRDTVQQPFQHIFCNYTPCFIKKRPPT